MATGLRAVCFALVAISCGSATEGDGDHGGDPGDEATDNGGGDDGDDDGDDGNGVDGGGGGNSPFQARSGTRIKMNIMGTPDGAKQFYGWHDVELDIDCGFQIATDGETRCLPSAQTPLNLYANSTCTEPMLGYPAAGCPPNLSGYFSSSETVGSSCDLEYRVRIYDGATSYEGMAYYRSGENCAMWPVADYLYALPGTEVAPSTFQSATLSIE
jgi:hypothetical protein